MNSPSEHYLQDVDNAGKDLTFGKDDKNTIFITTNIQKHFLIQTPSLDTSREQKDKFT